PGNKSLSSLRISEICDARPEDSLLQLVVPRQDLRSGQLLEMDAAAGTLCSLASNHLPAYKIGKLWKFKLADVNEWVRSGSANEQPARRLQPVRTVKPGRKR
ncbi:MAG TPA: hypothetical protein VGJ84_10460, partial [Polyangiaceae bacterium]